MSPAPASEHQRIIRELLVFLTPLLRRTGRGVLHVGINIFDEASPLEDYRIPDLTFVSAGREALVAKDGVRGGGPDVVMEVRSPGDESYEKLPFYAKLGVREVVIVDRDTRRVEVFALESGAYTARVARADGTVTSESLGVAFQTLPAKLVVSDAGDPSSSVEI